MRLTLIGGEIAIGRVVKIEAEALTIRRPSGGLRIIPLADIESLNLKTTKGDLIPGQIAKLADGGIVWTPFAAKDDTGRETSSPTSPPVVETGGPLVRLDDEAPEPPDVAIDDAGTDEDAGAKQDEVEIAALPENAATEPGSETEGSDNPFVDTSIRLEVTTEGADENDKLIYFKLTLSEPAPQPILIIYTMIDDTAKSPGDYDHRQGVVVFEPGETEATVVTSVTDDTAVEGPENFQFFVTGDPASVTIERRKIAATIEDDDG